MLEMYIVLCVHIGFVKLIFHWSNFYCIYSVACVGKLACSYLL